MKNLTHCPQIPFDPNFRGLFSSYLSSYDYGAHPFEYTGWRNETNAWKESCYINSSLNPTDTQWLKGPDALKFLSDHCVNNFEKFPVGTGKHGIMCNKDGFVMTDGIILRLDEDEFMLYWLSLPVPYYLSKGNYDVQHKIITGSKYLFQLCGPRSLEIVEAATNENLHDIKFMHHRMSSIAGKEVRILRAGMGGTLGYEVHGNIEDAIPVYNALIAAGEKYDLRKLGMRAYNMTHYEAGFPQFILDFFGPWFEDEDFKNFIHSIGLVNIGSFAENTEATYFKGSMGTDKKLRYRNPYDLGWGGMVKFNHDFIGREALEKIAANPPRKMVTLVWNIDDILDVHRSQFESGETYAPMDEPEDYVFYGKYAYHADQVLKDGKVVGISTGRMNSYWYRKMISLCSLDTEYCEIGTEVVVLWGDPGTRQKEIRATVARYPYLDLLRNEKTDVSTIPFGFKE